MSGQVISYGLAILLDNDISVCCPYQSLNGRNTIENLEPIRIPSVLCFTNSEITIGNVITDENERERVEYLCGFIRAFQGSLNTELMAEIKRKCSCLVNLTSDGNVEYYIRSLNNQRFSPALLLQLFIQLIVRHEEVRVSVPIREIVVIYPPSFSDIHAEYLRHLLLTFSQFRVHCVNRLSCEICAFLPSPITDLVDTKRVLLFQCNFSTFHIYACSINSTSIHINKHIVCTAFSKNAIVNRMKELVIRQYNGNMNDLLPKSSYRSVYSACNTVLEKLSLQSMVSVVIYVNERRFVCRMTDFIVNTMMEPVEKPLSQDVETILGELNWKKEELYSLIVSGDCYNIICYQDWIRQTFPSVVNVFANDITEIFINGIHPSVSLTAEELQPERFYHIFHTMSPHQPLSEATLKTILEDKYEGSELISPEEPQPEIVYDELPSIRITVTVDPEEEESIYEPPLTSKKPGSIRATVPVVELDSVKKGTTVSVSKKPVTRSDYSLRNRTRLREKLLEELEMKDQIGSDVFDSEREDYSVIQQMDEEDHASEKSDKNTKPKKEEEERTRPKRGKKEESGVEEKEPKKKRKTQTDRLKEEAANVIRDQLYDQKPRPASLRAIHIAKVQLQSQKRKRTKKEEKKEVGPKTKTERKMKENKKKSDLSQYALPPAPPSRIPSNLVFRHIPLVDLTQYRVTISFADEGHQEYCDDLIGEVYCNDALKKPIPPDASLPFEYEDGSVYEGSVHGGMRHGSGTLTYPDGSVYYGQFKENNRHGRGHILFRNIRVFEGMFDSNIPKKGKLQYCSKACYEGTFNRKGKPHGKGTFYADGHNATWEGMWKDGLPDGEGTYFYENGCYFIGTLVQGKRNGEGTIHNKKGKTLFTNTYKNDLEEGEGFIHRPGVGYIKTQFVNGQVEGEAICYNEEDQEIGRGAFSKGLYSGRGITFVNDHAWYKGEIIENEVCGEAEYHYSDDMYLLASFDRNQVVGKIQLYHKKALFFEGHYFLGTISGDGCEYYPDGSVMYEGNFSRGLRNGKGKLIFEDGSYYTGNFKYGFISGKGTYCNKSGEAVFTAVFSRGAINVEKSSL